MTAPPTAAITPLAPGPTPPPVAGAPTGTPAVVVVWVAFGLPVVPLPPVEFEIPDAVELAVGNGPSPLDAVGEALCEELGEAEHEGEALALAEEEADAEVLGELEAEALVVGVQVVAAEALHEGVALAELDADADGDADAELLALALAEEEADAEVLGVLEAVAVPLLQTSAVVALAAPPNDTVNAAKMTEISSAAVPAARPTSPTRCSFSQLLCRDRRKIVTSSGSHRISTKVVRPLGHYINP